MTARDSMVADLVAGQNSEARKASVHQRIMVMKSTLNKWLTDGIPPGKTTSLPSSLREARDWEDPELNIQPIGSPNDFTTTNRKWGQDVREIARLLTRLNNLYDQGPRTKKIPSQHTANKGDDKMVRQDLVAAVSQWHSERDARERERKRADAAETRLSLISAESAQKDSEIADLRSRLAHRDGLRVVE